MFYKKIVFVFFVFYFCFLSTFSFADDFLENDFDFYNINMEVSSTSSNIPSINAKHAVIFDRNSKTILFGKNENEKCKMASTTKIMTAIIVIENCDDLNSLVTVSKKAARNRWL